MADVFISYARSDRDRVAPLVAAIEDRGWILGPVFEKSAPGMLTLAKADPDLDSLRADPRFIAMVAAAEARLAAADSSPRPDHF